LRTSFPAPSSIAHCGARATSYGGGAPAQVRDPECQRNGDGTADQLNDELQRYVDYNSRGERLHVVADGVLTLRATKTGTRSGSPYEAAMIRSKYLFKPTADTTYFVTARVKLPNVRGTWPALWLNSDRRPDGTLNWPPEIDIFEGALNEKEDTADMLRLGAAVRSTGQTASGQREITFAAPEFNQRWTTYKAGHSLRDRWIETAIEWTIDEVCYFVDGARIMCERYAWALQHGRAGRARALGSPISPSAAAGPAATESPTRSFRPNFSSTTYAYTKKGGADTPFGRAGARLRVSSVNLSCARSCARLTPRAATHYHDLVNPSVSMRPNGLALPAS